MKVFILKRKMCVCVYVYTLGVILFLKEAIFFTQHSGKAPFWRIRILEVNRILEII